MKNSLSLQTHIPSTIINDFFAIIEAFETVCIFRHENPDGDAYGSQVGLKSALTVLYPEKKIFVLGSTGNQMPLFPKMDVIEDHVIESACAIILDCANRERIDDKRYSLAKTMIKIDHHPEVDVYGDFSYVDSQKASCCEIITELLMEKGALDKSCVNYLLAGMMTDTNRFSTEATSADTLMLAAVLMQQGANINQLTATLFHKDLKRHRLETKLASYIQYRDGVAWLIIDKNLRHDLNLTVSEAKLFNSTMANIKEYRIWAIFVEDDNDVYMASLRSQGTTINTIAGQYNGGGHRLACGIRDLNTQDVTDIIEKLIDAENYHEEN